MSHNEVVPCASFARKCFALPSYATAFSYPVHLWFLIANVAQMCMVWSFAVDVEYRLSSCRADTRIIVLFYAISQALPWATSA